MKTSEWEHYNKLLRTRTTCVNCGETVPDDWEAWCNKCSENEQTEALRWLILYIEKFCMQRAKHSDNLNDIYAQFLKIKEEYDE